LSQRMTATRAMTNITNATAPSASRPESIIWPVTCRVNLPQCRVIKECSKERATARPEENASDRGAGGRFVLWSSTLKAETVDVLAVSVRT
jgi:hypothetical protein